MSETPEMVERVARAIAIKATGKDEYWVNWAAEARAAIEAIPLEQLIRDAYVRGVEWGEENALDREYRFKASADYADKTLSALLHSIRGTE